MPSSWDADASKNNDFNGHLVPTDYVCGNKVFPSDYVGGKASNARAIGKYSWYAKVFSRPFKFHYFRGWVAGESENKAKSVKLS